MTYQKNWSDAVLASMHSAGRSWVEIRDRTGVSIDVAKTVVSRRKEPLRAARKEHTRAKMAAARLSGACGRRYDEHRGVDYTPVLVCPVLVHGQSGRSHGFWMEEMPDADREEW